MVEPILRQLDSWFNEPNLSTDRLNLLSKLAVLELCGWLEGEFDRLLFVAEQGKLADPQWMKNVISKTYGFRYEEHWRFMLVRLVGEIFVRRVEQSFEATSPGSLDILRSLLGSLWKIRCDLAHADMAANVAAQQTFKAPSWALSQHAILKALIDKYEQAMSATLTAI